MSAMTIHIVCTCLITWIANHHIALDSFQGRDGSTLEFNMECADACVQNINMHATAPGRTAARVELIETTSAVDSV
eukprot:CAMPEP_0115381456 /NCGR_PEP_ID=MMETSP0271-20121206/5581_1 /TAXON_ID=71861 /ORGANISM="Scrippsiella trochoidea, Strain CCMP3099" /LENGTH=75 /DNA_ID=CAMNT_0002804739 /DNA_START=1194 /DNA_END=1421 /DNA_ORIENTATION=+